MSGQILPTYYKHARPPGVKLRLNSFLGRSNYVTCYDATLTRIEAVLYFQYMFSRVFQRVD